MESLSFVWIYKPIRIRIWLISIKIFRVKIIKKILIAALFSIVNYIIFLIHSSKDVLFSLFVFSFLYEITIKVESWCTCRDLWSPKARLETIINYWSTKQKPTLTASIVVQSTPVGKWTWSSCFLFSLLISKPFMHICTSIQFTYVRFSDNDCSFVSQ